MKLSEFRCWESICFIGFGDSFEKKLKKIMNFTWFVNLIRFSPFNFHWSIRVDRSESLDKAVLVTSTIKKITYLKTDAIKEAKIK